MVGLLEGSLAASRHGRYKGNIYDLAAVLKLLPEKTLKALKLSHLYRQKSADGAEQTERTATT